MGRKTTYRSTRNVFPNIFIFVFVLSKLQKMYNPCDGASKFFSQEDFFGELISGGGVLMSFGGRTYDIRMKHICLIRSAFELSNYSLTFARVIP